MKLKRKRILMSRKSISREIKKVEMGSVKVKKVTEVAVAVRVVITS